VLDTNEKILDIAAAADILLWPLVLDGKYKDIEALADGHIDACFFNGGIRNSEAEHIAKLLRAKSKLVISFGACACSGGVPSLANLFTLESLKERVYGTTESTDNAERRLPSERVDMPEGAVTLPRLYDRVYPLDEIIKVDYYLPGCPPTPEWVEKAVMAVIGGALPPPGSVIGESKTLCDECPRIRTNKKSIKKFFRPHEIEADRTACLLEQGVVCQGPATRAGCRAKCIEVNIPCRGCYGSPPGVSDQGAKMLSAAASLVDSNDEAEIEKILSGIKDPAGTFYQFCAGKATLKPRPKEEKK
jgi:F420-non-reducing hydrogenase small subunit